MGRESVLLPAARTSLTITNSIARIRSHNSIVPLDHFFEMGDAQDVENVLGSEVLMTGPRSFFFANDENLTRPKNGRGSR